MTSSRMAMSIYIGNRIRVNSLWMADQKKCPLLLKPVFSRIDLCFSFFFLHSLIILFFRIYVDLNAPFFFPRESFSLSV